MIQIPSKLFEVSNSRGHLRLQFLYSYNLNAEVNFVQIVENSHLSAYVVNHEGVLPKLNLHTNPSRSHKIHFSKCRRFASGRRRGVRFQIVRIAVLTKNFYRLANILESILKFLVQFRGGVQHLVLLRLFFRQFRTGYTNRINAPNYLFKFIGMLSITFGSTRKAIHSSNFQTVRNDVPVAITILDVLNEIHHIRKMSTLFHFTMKM